MPDLGDQFVPGSIRNVSGPSVSKHGFAVFLAREAHTGLYCLVVHTGGGGSSVCTTAAIVAQRGLWMRTQVTVKSPVSDDSPLGDAQMAATLTSRGEFSMSFQPA